MSTKNEKLVTPAGIAMWAHVQKPKPAFVNKAGKTEGSPKYQIDVVFDPADPQWAPWVEGIRSQLKALPTQTRLNKETGKTENIPKQSPVKREFDDNDPPQATGKLVATFKTSDKYKPGVFDRYGRPIPETVLIGNGSKVEVSYTPNTYDGFGGGINFYLNAIRVIDLVEYQKQSADSAGFKVDQLPADAPPLAGESSAPASDTNGDDNIPF